MYVLCDFLSRYSLLGSFITCFGVYSSLLKVEREINREMSCSIITNQEVSSPDMVTVASGAKAKDPTNFEAARKGWNNYLKKLKDRLLRDNQTIKGIKVNQSVYIASRTYRFCWQ